MPGRGGPDWAATKTTVSPYCTKTAPLACLAISPVVRRKVRPPISRSTVTFTNIFLNDVTLETRERRPLRQPRSADHNSAGLAATRWSRRAEQHPQMRVCRDASDLTSSRCAPCARLEIRDTRTSDELLPDRKLILDVAESFGIRPSQVLEQALTFMDLHQQASPARVILLMALQVLGQVGDSLGQHGDLNFRRAGVRLGTLILANQLRLPIHTHLHAAIPTRFCIMLSVRNSTSESNGPARQKTFGPNLIPRLFQTDTLTTPADISTPTGLCHRGLEDTGGRAVACR